MPRSMSVSHRRIALPATIACLGLLVAVPAGAQSPSVAANLPALTQLWSGSGPAASQTRTWAPAIDPATGDIWVAASWDSAYWIFGPDGTYKESWGSAGSGPGQFDFVTTESQPSPFGSIAFAPDGSFYVADIGNYRVQAFDKDRDFVRQWGGFGTDDGQFARAWSIATDGTTVYVGDDSRYDIQAFDMDGTYLRTIAMGDGGPWTQSPTAGFFTLDRAGRIVTVGASGHPDDPTGWEVTILDPVTGQRVARYPVDVPGFLVGLAVDAAGDTFVNVVDADDGLRYVALVELDPSGATIGTWSTAGESVAVAPDDSAVYLAREADPELHAYSLPKP